MEGHRYADRVRYASTKTMVAAANVKVIHMSEAKKTSWHDYKEKIALVKWVDSDHHKHGDLASHGLVDGDACMTSLKILQSVNSSHKLNNRPRECAMAFKSLGLEVTWRPRTHTSRLWSCISAPYQRSQRRC